MAFTYKASPSPSGNANIRRVCTNSRCGGTFCISLGAQNYRCPIAISDSDHRRLFLSDSASSQSGTEGGSSHYVTLRVAPSEAETTVARASRNRRLVV